MNIVKSKDGTSIKYQQSGAGPRLILIGGSVRQKSNRLLDVLAPLLEPHFTVIRFDRRYQGRLQAESRTTDFMLKEIEDLKAVIVANGGSAYAFGVESGAELAQSAIASGLPILKLAIYEQAASPHAYAKHSNEFNIGTVLKLLNIKNKGKVIKMFMKAIGFPRVLLALLGLALFWPALKALAPALVYDALIMSEEYPGSVWVPAESNPTIVLTGQSNIMKGFIQSFMVQLPKICHDFLDIHNHDIDPKVLGNTLVGIFSHSLARIEQH